MTRSRESTGFSQGRESPGTQPSMQTGKSIISQEERFGPYIHLGPHACGDHVLELREHLCTSPWFQAGLLYKVSFYCPTRGLFPQARTRMVVWRKGQDKLTSDLPFLTFVPA